MKHLIRIVVLFFSTLIIGIHNLSGMQDETVHFIGDNTIQKAWKEVNAERFNVMYDLLSQMPPELIALILDYDVSPSEALANDQEPQRVKKVKAHNAPILCIVPMQEGCATATMHDVKLWDVQGALKKVLPTQMHTICCMLWLANKWLIVAGSTLDWANKKIETMQRWNPVTYQREEEIKEIDGEITTMIPLNAQKMAYGSSSGKIAVRDTQARHSEIFRRNDNRAICGLVMLDGMRMLSTDRSGVIQLWDLMQRKLMHQVVYRRVVVPDMMGGSDSDISYLAQMDSPRGKTDISLVAFITGQKKLWGIICISLKNEISSVVIKGISDAKQPIAMQTILQSSGSWFVLSNGEAQRIYQEKGRLPAFSLGNHITTAAVLRHPKNWIVSGNVQGELQYWR